MQIEQINGLGRQGLKISEEPQDEITADFREQMLLHNDIDGILNFDVHREDNHRTYEYNTSGMEPLQMVCARKRLKRDEVIEILGGILKTVYHSREFMLLEDDYVIRPDTIFIEAAKVRVAYFSGYRVSLRQQLCDLSEYLMDRIEYKDEGAVLLVYSFYSKTKNDNCSLEDLFDILSDSNTEAIPETPHDITQNVPAQAGLPVYDAAAPALDQTAFREIVADDSFTPPRITDVIRQSPRGLRLKAILIPLFIIIAVAAVLKMGLFDNPATGRPYALALFGTLFAALCLTVEAERLIWKQFYSKLVGSLQSAITARDEATVMVYSDGTVSYPFSLVSDEFEAINVSRFPFVIGKSKELSDYCFDKVGVSRQHLKIDRAGNGFSVTDLNSTNGTFVNRNRLRPGVPVSVKCGDEIKIGNYIFYSNK